ncbi:hypothetical protein PR003_g17266 [Phytophthora rubi]|uniref:Uncharacterized protein n=1 Tax=Phytophthora rubi TaxID=129364 RepID=A0A6A4ES34_9STRA|nr:hypothetical protein PR002_g16647 [Phytophthora rubi]KAE9322290.1 hypothetical protein PR003_g17266 [Phytophthora rubi]
MCSIKTLPGGAIVDLHEITILLPPNFAVCQRLWALMDAQCETIE